MFLTVIVGRHLAGILRAREQAARLDAVHVSVGSQLLGVTDAVEIRQIAWAAYARVCAAMPGLRVLKVVTDGAALRVDGATGGFAGVPATLPATVLSVLGGDGGTGRQTVHRRVELDAAAGTPCSWACILLPDIHDQHGRAWLLLGSPGSVSTEAVVSVASLANQVALALRNGEVHQELTVQATLDSLTGLVNRASFNAALSGALDDGPTQNTTVLFVDLDDFKDVNDAFGHGAGDQLLREVAVRLRRATRPGDLCARIGGDEFAVLLRDTGGGSRGRRPKDRRGGRRPRASRRRGRARRCQRRRRHSAGRDRPRAADPSRRRGDVHGEGKWQGQDSGLRHRSTARRHGSGVVIVKIGSPRLFGPGLSRKVRNGGSSLLASLVTLIWCRLSCSLSAARRGCCSWRCPTGASPTR